MIKYTNECPHEDLRNQYYKNNRHVKESHIFKMYDSFTAAKENLKRIPMREYAKIVEFDLRATQEFVPTEHFFSPGYKNKYYVPKEPTIAPAKLH